MQKSDMSDRDDNDDLIKNPETRTRRAWVERALAAVRRRLERGEDLSPGSDKTEAPRLYVVPPVRKR